MRGPCGVRLATVTAPNSTSVFRDRRGPVLIAIMLSSALMAVDATILATAVPSIVDDLGDFARYP